MKGKEGEGVLGTWRFDEELVRKILAKMIIIYGLLFKFVEGEEFELIAVLYSKFCILMMDSHTGLLSALFEREVEIEEFSEEL